MRTLPKGFLILTGIYIFFISAFLSEEERSHFGDVVGNMLLYIEIGVAICGYIGYRLWKKGKRCKVITGWWFIGALLLAFLAWFVQPSQIYRRAFDRIAYVENYIDSFPDASDKAKRRGQVDLEARKLEYQAAKLRFKADPQFSWSNFSPMVLWIGVVIFVVNGIITISGKKKAK